MRHLSYLPAWAGKVGSVPAESDKPGATRKPRHDLIIIEDGYVADPVMETAARPVASGVEVQGDPDVSSAVALCDVALATDDPLPTDDALPTDGDITAELKVVAVGPGIVDVAAGAVLPTVTATFPARATPPVAGNDTANPVAGNHTANPVAGNDTADPVAGNDTANGPSVEDESVAPDADGRSNDTGHDNADNGGSSGNDPDPAETGPEAVAVFVDPLDPDAIPSRELADGAATKRNGNGPDPSGAPPTEATAAAPTAEGAEDGPGDEPTPEPATTGEVPAVDESGSAEAALAGQPDPAPGHAAATATPRRTSPMLVFTLVCLAALALGVLVAWLLSGQASGTAAAEAGRALGVAVARPIG